MGWIGDSVESIRSLQIRHVLTQIVTLGTIVALALIIWKILMCVTGSESPVVVVLSESMEPGFKRVSSIKNLDTAYVANHTGTASWDSTSDRPAQFLNILFSYSHGCMHAQLV